MKEKGRPYKKGRTTGEQDKATRTREKERLAEKLNCRKSGMPAPGFGGVATQNKTTLYEKRYTNPRLGKPGGNKPRRFRVAPVREGKEGGSWENFRTSHSPGRYRKSLHIITLLCDNGKGGCV